MLFLGCRNSINFQKSLGCKKVNSIFQDCFGRAYIFSSINMLINFAASCVIRLKNITSAFNKYKLVLMPEKPNHKDDSKINNKIKKIRICLTLGKLTLWYVYKWVLALQRGAFNNSSPGSFRHKVSNDFILTVWLREENQNAGDQLKNNNKWRQKSLIF